MFSLISKFLTFKLLDEASFKAQKLLVNFEDTISKILFSVVIVYVAGIFFISAGLIFLSALFMHLIGFSEGVVPAIWTGAASAVVSLLLFFIAKGSLDRDDQR